MTAVRQSIIEDKRFWKIDDDDKRFGMMITLEALIRIGEETDPDHTGDGSFPKPSTEELQARCQEVWEELRREASAMLPHVPTLTTLSLN